jgi:hypothetical protein
MALLPQLPARREYQSYEQYERAFSAVTNARPTPPALMLAREKHPLGPLRTDQQSGGRTGVYHMKTIFAGAAALVAVTLSASIATAAPYANIGTRDAGFKTGIIQVHGVHRECVEGRWGWHRSTPWGGRIACQPAWKKWHHGGRGHGSRHHEEIRPEPRRIPRGSH